MKIKGFITTAETAALVEGSITKAFTDRKELQCVAFPAVPFKAGTEHEGKVFIAFADHAPSYPVRRGLKLSDFPEFDQLIAMLGGLDARVEVDSVDFGD